MHQYRVVVASTLRAPLGKLVFCFECRAEPSSIVEGPKTGFSAPHKSVLSDLLEPDEK